MTRTVHVHLVALHVACTTCGTRARILGHDDPYQAATAPFPSFWAAHYAPRITAADLLVDGQPRTCPVRTVNRQETP